MSDSLAKDLEKFLLEKLALQKENRELINLIDIGEGAVGGLLVSKEFAGLSSERQMSKLESFLRDFEKQKSMRTGIIPAILVYSPEEYRLANREEREGVLRSVGVHTFAANDLVVSIDPNYWMARTKKIDLDGNEDREWNIQAALRREKNPHLFDFLSNQQKTPISYKWFDCDGYYFDSISEIKFIPMGIPNLLTIEFSGKHVPPWEVPDED